MSLSAQSSSGAQSDVRNSASGVERADVAGLVFGISKSSILTLCGINARELRALLDDAKSFPETSRALSVAISSASSVETVIDKVTAYLAETALRLWPAWYHGSGVKFDICRNDALGRQAARVLANEVGTKITGVLPLWVEQAANLALDGRVPRVAQTSLATEFDQLTKAIAPEGLVLVAPWPSEDTEPCADAFVRALEWMSKTCGVIALFDELPVNESPFDRILYGARIVSSETFGPDEQLPEADLWIAPWRGMPHPLSDVEKRLAKAIAADNELRELFGFNQPVHTIHGSRPKVDLLWAEGRLVVELDGYESHGNRTAFAQDRHRDYELMLSGYAVLRLTNVEIAQDCEKALEKIRDLVHLRHQTLTKEV